METDAIEGSSMELAQHCQATRLHDTELVRQLIAHLGPTLVAALANVRDRKLPHKWAKPDGPSPRSESLFRLQAAYRAWLAVAGAEGDHVARSWFIGANPRLGDETPIACLREGQAKVVLAAARAFADGLDD